MAKVTNKERWMHHFDQLAPEYARYKSRFRYFWKDTVKYFNYFLTDENSILEIGCGIGDTLQALRGSHKLGIDFSQEMIQVAQSKYPDIEFKVMDAASLSLDRTYDVIVLSNVIGNLSNVLDVFIQLKPCCHARTKIFICSYSKLWEPIINLAELLGIKKKAPQQNWLSRHDIINLLYLAGFENYRKSARMLAPVNIPIVSFIANKYLANLPLFNQLCLNQYLFAKPLPSSIAEPDLSKYSVSVVIPARNESGNIERAILDTPEMGNRTEIIFIEGHSTDDTWDKIVELKEKYQDKRELIIDRQEGKGKYDAVKKGFELATGDILMILDADLTVPPIDLEKFYGALVTGKGEFINGCRLIYPMEQKAMRFLNVLGNKFFSLAFSWLLEQPVKDTLCGTKVIYAKDYEKLAENRKYFGDFDPFGDFDLLFGAYKLNLKIIDLPIRYRERTYGDTNISRFRHGLILLRMVFFAMGKIKFY